MKRKIKIEIYQSFEEENRAEYQRRKEMTPEQRCAEFAALQERMWGEKWRSERMRRIATWERTNW